MYRFYQPHLYKPDTEDFDETDHELRTIQGKQFEEFLDFCFSYASYFSLTKAPWLYCTNKSLEKELSQHYVRKILSRRWFCYRFPESSMEILIYSATPDTKAILLRYFTDLFLRQLQNNELIDSDQTMEDLCLFTQDALFLGTVSHECICYAYPPDALFEKRLADFGKWSSGDDSIEDQILLSQYN